MSGAGWRGPASAQPSPRLRRVRRSFSGGGTEPGCGAEPHVERSRRKTTDTIGNSCRVRAGRLLTGSETAFVLRRGRLTWPRGVRRERSIRPAGPFLDHSLHEFAIAIVTNERRAGRTAMHSLGPQGLCIRFVIGPALRERATALFAGVNIISGHVAGGCKMRTDRAGVDAHDSMSNDRAWLVSSSRGNRHSSDRFTHFEAVASRANIRFQKLPAGWRVRPCRARNRLRKWFTMRMRNLEAVHRRRSGGWRRDACRRAGA